MVAHWSKYREVPVAPVVTVRRIFLPRSFDLYTNILYIKNVNINEIYIRDVKSTYKTK